MTRKRVSLDAVFGEVLKTPPTKKPRLRKDVQTDIVTQTPKAEGQGGGPNQKRPGVKQHTAYLPLAVHEQLRRLAFEENRKIHDYLMEGLDRIFADRGLAPIKELK